MSSFHEILAASIRIAMLVVLEKAPGCLPAASVQTLIAHAGPLSIAASIDQVRTEARWLADQGLVTVEEAGLGIQTIAITDRGVEVARGLATVPGVIRPPRGHI